MSRRFKAKGLPKAYCAAHGFAEAVTGCASKLWRRTKHDTAVGQKRGEWIANNRKEIDFDLRVNDLSMNEIIDQPMWPTLGKYVSDKKPGGGLTAHQDFLRTFTYGRWREYSAMAHGAFEGLMPVAMYDISRTMPVRRETEK